MIEPETPRPGGGPRDDAIDPASDALIADGFQIPDISASNDAAPPSYGDVMNELHLSQLGFEAGAAITSDGRVNINIWQKNSRLSQLLAPTIRNQLSDGQQASGRAHKPPTLPCVSPSTDGEPSQAPLPKMNVVIQIVGSRGDVQPFVALGQVLRLTYGHRVRIATHATFQKFVEENGLEFFNIGGDPAEMMAFMVRNPGLMPGVDALTSGEVVKRRKEVEKILAGCWRSCIEAGKGMGPAPPPLKKNSLPENRVTGTTEVRTYEDEADRPFVADAIIANPPSFAHIHIAEKLGIPLHMMFTMPWSPTRAFPHPLANIQSTNTDVTMTTYVSYMLVEMMTWQGLGDVINRFRSKALDLQPLSLMWAPGLLTRSPSLIPKPNDWGNHISIPGFYFLNLASSYSPPADLSAYLAAGPPPVYIGFGSIVVDDPNALTRLIFDAVTLAGVRAIVSQGWGGLGGDAVGLPPGVFMLGNCPHDWLFQHVSAVVHHGGAGTTAAGIKSGKPTVVVPFFGDQPFWGSMIKRAGAGPAPIPHKSLTAENLAAALKECLKPETQARARELGMKIREEKGCEMGAMKFHDHLPVDDLRCSFLPSRIAAWRIRRTKIRLCALAGEVLMREGLLQLSDLKLYRSSEYGTEEKPWDPITAGTASFLADIGTIGMGLAEVQWGAIRAAKGGGKIRDTSQEASSSSQNDTASIATAAQSQPGLSSQSTTSLMSQQSTTVAPPSAAVTSLDSPSELSLSSSTRAATAQATASRSLDLSRSLSAPASASASNTTGPSTNTIIDTEKAHGLVTACRGASRIVETSIMTPMNMCQAMAKGFRNAPLLYNDSTVRPQEKITDAQSGVKAAAKELSMGIFDGVTGLVTQPIKGAKEHGTIGLVKGIGKGLGGLLLKPTAGILGLPAYTFQGLQEELRSMYARNMQGYIVHSRLTQGEDSFAMSTREEKREIVAKWQAMSSMSELQPFYLYKGREIAVKAKEREASGNEHWVPPSWLRNVKTVAIGSSLEQGRRTGQGQEQLSAARSPTGVWHESQSSLVPTVTSSSGGSFNTPLTEVERTTEDEEFERAIRESVQETSRGNAEEDAMVEKAVRQSVSEIRRRQGAVAVALGLGGPIVAEDDHVPQAEVMASFTVSPSGSVASSPPARTPEGDDSAQPQSRQKEEQYHQHHQHQHQHHQQNSGETHLQAAPLSNEEIQNILSSEDMQVTDEEYQCLVEQAIQQSMMVESQAPSNNNQGDDDFNDQIRRAIAASASEAKGKMTTTIPPTSCSSCVDEDMDEDLKKALELSTNETSQEELLLRQVLEESAREEAREREEEEIMMELVRRQSLVEEEWRRKKGKGKERVFEDGDKQQADDEDEYDEELKRAMAESLKVTGGDATPTNKGRHVSGGSDAIIG